MCMIVQLLLSNTYVCSCANNMDRMELFWKSFFSNLLDKGTSSFPSNYSIFTEKHLPFTIFILLSTQCALRVRLTMKRFLVSSCLLWRLFPRPYYWCPYFCIGTPVNPLLQSSCSVLLSMFLSGA